MQPRHALAGTENPHGGCRQIAEQSDHGGCRIEYSVIGETVDGVKIECYKKCGAARTQSGAPFTRCSPQSFLLQLKETAMSEAKGKLCGRDKIFLPIAVERILLEYTGNDSSLSVAEIREKAKSLYGIDARGCGLFSDRLRVVVQALMVLVRAHPAQGLLVRPSQSISRSCRAATRTSLCPCPTSC